MPYVVNPSGILVNIPDPTAIQKLIMKEPYADPVKDENGKILARGMKGWRHPTPADFEKAKKLNEVAQKERAEKIALEAQNKASTVIVQQVVDPGVAHVVKRAKNHE